MTPWLVVTFSTLGAALIAYIGLTLWAWRTSDGAGWRSFCLVATTDLGRTLCWVGLVLEEPARYQNPPELIKLVLAFQFVGAVFTCALALALRRGWMFRREQEEEKWTQRSSS